MIPTLLDYKLSWKHEEEVRVFFCTSFSGNAEGLKMDMAAEAQV